MHAMYHLVDLLNRQTDVGGLESRGEHCLGERVERVIFSQLEPACTSIENTCRAHVAVTYPRTLTELSAMGRSEEHTSELQSLMRNSYAVFCLKKKKYSIQSTSKRTHANFYIHTLHHNPYEHSQT